MFLTVRTMRKNNIYRIYPRIVSTILYNCLGSHKVVIFRVNVLLLINNFRYNSTLTLHQDKTNLYTGRQSFSVYGSLSFIFIHYNRLRVVILIYFFLFFNIKNKYWWFWALLYWWQSISVCVSLSFCIVYTYLYYIIITAIMAF